MPTRLNCRALSFDAAATLLVGACALLACGTSADRGGIVPDGSVGAGPEAASSGSGSGPPGTSSGSGSSGGSSGSGSGSGSTVSGSGSGSGSSPSGLGSGAPSSGGSSGSNGNRGDGGAIPTGASVLQHHTNPTRDGVYIDPLMTQPYAKTLKPSPTFAPTITGNVYAQPLYIVPGPPGYAEGLIVATEGTAMSGTHVTVLDPATGGVIWDKTYGTPVTGGLGCGNIFPLGITGTPIVDPTTRILYFDAMDASSGAPKHMIHAVLLDNMGAEASSGWPVDVGAKVTGFDSRVQNQRGALALLHGELYVPYGGHDGDCGPYHGWVVGVNVGTPASVTAFATASKFPTGAAGATRGGIWGVGGIASDGVSSLFVTTGNTLGAGGTWSGGEAVLRLGSPGPTFSNTPANAFYPSAWAQWDAVDWDLGGANPVVFDLADADGGVSHLVAALGKDGNLYLLSRDNLGGPDATMSQFSKTLLASGEAAPDRGNLNAASAVYRTTKGTYIAFHANARTTTKVSGCANPGNLGVARITPGNPPTAAVVWCSIETSLGSPMVTTTGTGDVIVWDANTHLYGYDGDTGTKVFDGTAFPMASPMHYFNTPIGANGRIVVATSEPGHLYVFAP